tara:strand:+ start:741 stop:902 length:162 start_codon:yes stop_codon:yes gene_type:complete
VREALNPLTVVKGWVVEMLLMVEGLSERQRLSLAICDEQINRSIRIPTCPWSR